MRRPSTQAGSSLVEVVIALGILLILMIGILQMFSMAYLTNLNAAAGTELAYKAQQTAEVLKWGLYQKAMGLPVGTGSHTLDPNTYLIASGAPFVLPTSSSGPNWGFWGPSYLGVIGGPNPPYDITYTIVDGGASWNVTVQVRARTTGTGRYVGVAKRGKVVEYVIQAPKAAP